MPANVGFRKAGYTIYVMLYMYTPLELVKGHKHWTTTRVAALLSRIHCEKKRDGFAKSQGEGEMYILFRDLACYFNMFNI